MSNKYVGGWSVASVDPTTSGSLLTELENISLAGIKKGHWIPRVASARMSLQAEGMMKNKTKQMIVRGTEVQDGDYVVCAVTHRDPTQEVGLKNYAVLSRWSVNARKTPHGLGWDHTNGTHGTWVETRWHKDYLLLVERPLPEENEFGVVTP